MPSPPSRCFSNPPKHPKPQQQEQQQTPANDQSASAAKAAAIAMRKQWTAKAASFQRGLEHVQNCHAGDACSSSLCHSTRRLMKTYATHPCSKKNSNSSCRVCKLWDFLMASQQQPRLQRSLAQHGSLSCGTALVQSRRLTRPSAILRRITTGQKEAQTMIRRF